MRKALPWLLRLIGPTLLVVFLVKSDMGQLVTILRGANLWPVLLSLLLMPPFLVIKAWRWQRIQRELGLHLPMRLALGLYLVGIYLGSVTPGQAGDLVKAWYLRERGQPLAPALLSVVIDRLFDLVVMAFFALIGLVAIGQLLPSRMLQSLLVVATTIGLTLFTVVLVARGPRQWVLTRLLPAILPQRIHTSLMRWNEQLATMAMHPRMLLPVGAASLLSASFTFYRLWLLFAALGVHIPITIVVGVSALIAILQILPISVAGVGVRDAALMAVLLPYSYSTEQALSLSALFLLLTIEQTIAGFVVSFWYPLAATATTAQVPADQSVP